MLYLAGHFYRLISMPPKIFENRLPVPSSVPARHFLYKTQPLIGCDDEISLLGNQAFKMVCDIGISPGEIELLMFNDEDHPQAVAALVKIQAALPSSVFDHGRHKFDILFAELALPHADPDYTGWAFVSVVLHTGPHPYVLQMLHTEQIEESNENVVRTSSVLLRPGDVVVFDPSTPHLCVPATPHEDQLLVLAQVSVMDVTEEDRNLLVSALPPQPRVEEDPTYSIVLNNY